ncbi:MAG: hypothetical protein CMI12_05775 [Oceanospirillum sp.]|nr:hypothetical protein [Oceanospirillum sp.]
MGNKSLYFELFAIAFLLIAGSVLLMSGLPGWGLITIAGILSALSFGLRKTAAHTSTNTSANEQAASAMSSNTLVSHSLTSEAA